MPIIIDGTDSSHIRINNVKIYNASQAVGDHSIVVGSNSRVLDCWVEGGDYGIASYSDQDSHIIVRGNEVKSANTCVFSEEGNITVDGNDLYNNGDDYSVHIKDINHAVVSNNRIYNYDGGDGIYLQNVSRFAVVGNVVHSEQGGG